MARSGKPDFSLSKISDKPVVDGGHCKEILSHVAAASVIGIIAASVTFYHRRKPKAQMNQKVIPRIDRTGSGRFGKLERFSDYVARQLDFSDVNECPQLRKLTIEYLRMSKGCEDSIFEYFSGEPEAESLWVKLIEEIDKCILSYFAFHWSQSSLLISQVLSVESEQNPKFKNFVLAATRWLKSKVIESLRPIEKPPAQQLMHFEAEVTPEVERIS